MSFPYHGHWSRMIGFAPFEPAGLTTPNPTRLSSFFLFGSGVTHAWFRDNFGGEEKALAERAGTSAFELPDERARTVPPGSEGLISLSLLGGRGYPCDPDIRGMWIGHTWCHKREHFHRSLLESFAEAEKG